MAKKCKKMADGGMAAPMAGSKGFRSRRMPGEAGRPAGPVSKGGMAGRVGAGMGSAFMRGGGLARKGVGQALAKGGMVKGCGCTKRGVKKAKTY